MKTRGAFMTEWLCHTLSYSIFTILDTNQILYTMTIQIQIETVHPHAKFIYLSGLSLSFCVSLFGMLSRYEQFRHGLSKLIDGGKLFLLNLIIGVATVKVKKWEWGVTVSCIKLVWPSPLIFLLRGWRIPQRIPYFVFSPPLFAIDPTPLNCNIDAQMLDPRDPM